MPRSITENSRLNSLKREAKRWLKDMEAGAPAALERYRRLFPDGRSPAGLRDIQHALAMEHGLSGWGALKARLAPDSPMRRYDAVVSSLVAAYAADDAEVLKIVHDYFGHRRSWAGFRRHVRLVLGGPDAPTLGWEAISVAQARTLVARGQGVADWKALTDLVARQDPGDRTMRPVSIFDEGSAGPRADIASAHTWSDAFVAMAGLQAPGLNAHGQMTDVVLDRIVRHGAARTLELGGSRAVSNAGLRALGRLDALRRLDLSRSGVDDQGLTGAALPPHLEALSLDWTSVTDRGAARLSSLRSLRKVSLMGTPTGDGAIRALAGIPGLADFRSGDRVTDTGLALLHDLPVFKAWQGGASRMDLMSYDAEPNYLLLRGTVTDAGLRRLVGLDGLFALNLASDRLAVTSAGVAPLAALPHLAWLAFDADDHAMREIAALPHLRFLMCQDTSAGDAGFVALSRSSSIAYIWGRRCENLGARGFAALADMSALQALSVSCRNVGQGLSALPSFPALKTLMPIDAPDDGYRYIGACDQLEELILMYCRDTSDVATRHLARLPRLRRYFASYTRITDETPRILATMSMIEDITFDGCAGLTAGGIGALASLPKLRRLRLSGMPGVPADVRDRFGENVSIAWSP